MSAVWNGEARSRLVIDPRAVGSFNRRLWLRRASRWTALAVLGTVGSSKTSAAGEPPGDDPARLEAARARAIQVGMDATRFRDNRSVHFQATGTAPHALIGAALTASERLLRDLRGHLKVRGIELVDSPQRMTLVALADRGEFARFLGEDLGAEVGGVYDLDANWLLMFDNRGDDSRGVAPAERVNTLVLMHETIHLITFNLGPLNREGDVPLCVAEGLAMYGETRSTARGAAIGKVNTPRLQGLLLARRAGIDWFSLPNLLTHDDLLNQPDTQQAAYAQSWLLVYHLLNERRWRPKFAAYLATIHPRRDPSHRLDDAQATLGDLAALDRELRALATRLVG